MSTLALSTLTRPRTHASAMQLSGRPSRSSATCSWYQSFAQRVLTHSFHGTTFGRMLLVRAVQTSPVKMHMQTGMDSLQFPTPISSRFPVIKGPPLQSLGLRHIGRLQTEQAISGSPNAYACYSPPMLRNGVKCRTRNGFHGCHPMLYEFRVKSASLRLWYLTHVIKR